MQYILKLSHCGIMVCMTELDIAWAAGLLEGEGSFTARTNSPVLRVSCVMTDLDILERLQSIFGGLIHKNSRDTKHYKDHWKDSWSWSASGDTAKTIMTSVLPYMGGRRSNKINELLESRKVYEERVSAKLDNCTQAALYYLNNDTTLQKTAPLFGVSWETVRRHVARVRAEQGLLPSEEAV